MAIKKVLLKKKIEGVIYDLYVKSSADIVAFSESQSVAEKITDMVGILDGLTTGDNSVDKKIAAAKTEVINQIMGATDGEQIAQAFDTIKEIADYLDGHGLHQARGRRQSPAGVAGYGDEPHRADFHRAVQGL